MFETKCALAGLLAAGALLSAAPAFAQTFPQDAQWLPLTKDGAPIGDPLGDSQSARDIVGDAANPAAYVFSDGTNLFFRLRVDGAVLQSPGEYKPFGWACLLDTDGDLMAYEFSAGVDGIANPDVVEFRKNMPQASPNDPKDIAEILLASYPPATHARQADTSSMFGGDPDYFIDWAIDTSDMVAAGILPSTPIIFICGTSNNAQSLAADLITSSGGTTLVELGTDPITCDATGCHSGSCDGSGDACTAGVGECRATGVTVCDAQNMPVCSAMPGQPVTEICDDGKDNDCDGAVDDGCPDKPCQTDADCGGADSGRVCDPATNICVNGCHSTGNGCASGQECTSTTDSIGECVGIDVKCSDDSVCGSATSGRVCDVAKGICVDGCHQGGNGCPDGRACSSTDASLGQCADEEPRHIVASGSGIFCATGHQTDTRPAWLLALALGAAAARRRRRRQSGGDR